MEYIDEKKTAKELDALGAGVTIRELILNNIRFYNDLITDYLLGITKNYYLTYQLNVQITKQMTDLKKVNPKEPGEEDAFAKMMEGIKGPKKDKNQPKNE